MQANYNYYSILRVQVVAWTLMLGVVIVSALIGKGIKIRQKFNYTLTKDILINLTHRTLIIQQLWELFNML